MTAVRRRLRIARILARWAVQKGKWFGYAPLGRPLTRRERASVAWRKSRAYAVLTLPVQVMRAPAELGEP